MSRRMKRKVNKKKYIALIFGVMIVALLASGSILQSTYALGENWSLKMSISSMSIAGEPVWPGDSVRVMGDAENGYDIVAISVDEMSPINPYGMLVQREDTGKPMIGAALGSFTQPIASVDDQSIPGSKIYTYQFTGYISMQTFAAESVVDVYTYTTGVETAGVTEIAELGPLNNIEMLVEFSLVAGPGAKGSCVFEDIVVTGSHQMVDVYGAAAEYEYASSLKVSTINTLEATEQTLDTGVKVTVSGDMAAGAEILNEELTLYNTYAEFPVSFKVVQTVGELEDARFNVPSILNLLPASANAIIEDPLSIVVLLIVVIVIILIFAGVSYLYGNPSKRP